VTAPAIPVATLRSTPAAGAVSPLTKESIPSWLSWTQSSTLVRSSRRPTGPCPARAWSISSGSCAANFVPSWTNGKAKAVTSPPSPRNTTRKTRNVASARHRSPRTRRWTQAAGG
jgi:hypothetical protein